MEKCNNRIITLSGDPASGKGTISKQLKTFYEAEGHKVHIVSVGDLFRKVSIREYKKMFPEVSNPTIEQINSNPDFAEKLKEIDGNIDTEIAKLGEEINSEPRPNEVFIIDSRVAWHMIPESFAVRLTVDEETAGKRVFNDKTRGAEDKYASVENAITDTKIRRAEEIERYKELYGIDLTNPNNYDLIIGTTLASINDIAKTIKICEERERDCLYFSKTWASPELFYPTQTVSDTYSKSSFTAGLTPEELAESIKENGIYPYDPVISTTITDSPYQFVSDGHHRVFASIMAGQTLIPYEARRNVGKATIQNQRSLTQIYDHEDIHRPDGTLFRYEKYPEIDGEIKEYDIGR